MQSSKKKHQHFGAYQDWESFLYAEKLKNKVDSPSKNSAPSAQRFQPLWIRVDFGSNIKQIEATFTLFSELLELNLFSHAKAQLQENNISTDSQTSTVSWFIDDVEKVILLALYNSFLQQKKSHDIQSISPVLTIFVLKSALSSRDSVFSESSGLSRLNDYIDFIYLGLPISVTPQAQHGLINQDFKGIGGLDYSKTIGAIIDDGIGYLNHRFYQEGGKPRFAKIWLQSNPTPLDETYKSVDAGVELSREDDSDANLQSIPNRDPLKYLDEISTYAKHRASTNSQKQPGANSTSYRLTHGTHVADLAFGAGANADEAWMRSIDLLGVDLPRSSVLATHGKFLDTNVLQGLRWVIANAILMSITSPAKNSNPKWRPLVVNISFGSHAGSKDGHDFLCELINEQLQMYGGIAGLNGEQSITFARAVLAYGNHGADSLTAVVKPQESSDEQNSKLPSNLSWRVLPDDLSPSYLEIRCDGDSAPEVEISLPTGETFEIKALKQGELQDINSAQGVVGRVYAEYPSLLSKNKFIYVLAIAPTRSYSTSELTAPAGAWQINIVHDQAVGVQVARDDTPSGFAPFGRQSYLEHPNSNAKDSVFGHYLKRMEPLLDEGNQSAWTDQIRNHTESVGASLALRGESLKPWRHTSKGSEKPELGANNQPNSSAVGSQTTVYHGIRAAGTLSGSTARMAGTSVAAPQRTRAILKEWLDHNASNAFTPKAQESQPNIDPKHRAQLGEYWTAPRKFNDGIYLDE